MNSNIILLLSDLSRSANFRSKSLGEGNLQIILVTLNVKFTDPEHNSLSVVLFITIHETHSMNVNNLTVLYFRLQKFTNRNTHYFMIFK